MRALVVYESMYGNTHEIADHIAEGLRAVPGIEAEAVPVSEATPERIGETDLLVVGGPTHVHHLSTESSRKAAVERAADGSIDLTVDAGAEGEGLRDWFHQVGRHHGAAAAFDTRLDMSAVITGRASRGIAHRLRRNGYELIADPASFFVDKQTHLLPGQDAEAVAWGTELGDILAARAASTADDR